MCLFRILCTAVPLFLCVRAYVCVCMRICVWYIACQNTSKRHEALKHIAKKHVAFSCAGRTHDKRERFGTFCLWPTRVGSNHCCTYCNMLTRVCASEISPISHYFTCRGHYPQLWPAPIKTAIWVCSRRVMHMCSAEYIVLFLAPSPEMSMHAPGEENVAPNEMSMRTTLVLDILLCAQMYEHSTYLEKTCKQLPAGQGGDTCWKCCIEGRNGSAQESMWHYTYIFLPICLIVVEQQLAFLLFLSPWQFRNFAVHCSWACLAIPKNFGFFFALHFPRNFAESSHHHGLVAG